MQIVAFRKRAQKGIESVVTAAQNQFEVGGLLLGHKCFGGYIVVAVTVPAENSSQDKAQFHLNGSYHSHMADLVARNYWLKPKIVGVWHSHICDGVVFSEQDNISNLQLAEILNGCISILVSLRPKRFAWAAYRIYPTRTISKMKILKKHK